MDYVKGVDYSDPQPGEGAEMFKGGAGKTIAKRVRLPKANGRSK